jgi:small-conductance mechanosensitive channel
MFKQFLLKKMMASQLKALPSEQRALIEKIIDTKPELLMQIAQEAQGLMKAGQSQQDALMTVSKKYEAEFKQLMGK